jgi:integrase
MAAPAIDVDERDELLWLRAEWLRQRLRIEELIQTARDQARTIAELTGAEPGAAPSVACVYWLYAPTRWDDRCWPGIVSRIRHAVDDLADRPANLVTPLVWEQHRARRKQLVSRLGRPVTDETIAQSFVQFRAMLKWAARHGMIKRNPLDDMKTPPVSRTRETSITPLDLESLLARAEDIADGRMAQGDDDGQRCARLTAFLLLVFDSMMRPGEARMLVRSRITPDGVYELRGSESKGKRPRTLALTPRTLEAIKAVHPVGGSPHLFANPETGRPFSGVTVGKWFRRARDLAGLNALAAPADRRLVMHDLRASGATTADLAGARPQAIKVALGHASLNTTQRYLRSSRISDAREVGAIMEKATRRAPHKVPRGRTRNSKSKAR